MNLKETTTAETETKETFRSRMLSLMNEADQAIAESGEYLIRKGKVLDLTEWVTIKECKAIRCRRWQNILEAFSRSHPTKNQFPNLFMLLTK